MGDAAHKNSNHPHLRSLTQFVLVKSKSRCLLNQLMVSTRISNSNFLTHSDILDRIFLKQQVHVIQNYQFIVLRVYSKIKILNSDTIIITMKIYYTVSIKRISITSIIKLLIIWYSSLKHLRTHFNPIFFCLSALIL